mmetsp:Transcript_1766/g.2638  ORF Transcript_1766/g.2638 Transcript_1766/m.2638 type:complete len:383 (+) Transcript_1766:59-1207(+)|eukprot:CAMPEP_0195527548 /NCGR_PEP_ID=MMETSP0794_2-20130614/29268_1 /TAXON_ID=515487 /ORGANISM="Stephanopyxis turris, Strain CCMP 815" /LENGTH=382 /DNA_ID=CAMNT_0040658477 /DNA_START=58 /DNA_END=1206 /DNA_ORIENTATION=+
MEPFSLFKTKRRGKVFALLLILVIELIGFVTYTADDIFINNFNASSRELISRIVESVVPNRLDGFKNSWEEFSETDTAVFLHIPKSGGGSFKDIFGDCLGLAVASEVGIQDGHDQDTEIGIHHFGESNFGEGKYAEKRSKFVNVDTTTLPGLERAKHMGLIQSGLADVMVTRHLYEVNSLFDSQHKGRLFAVFRHPVERIASTFSYLQLADWEEAYSHNLAGMTLEEYAKTIYMDDNWLTRLLSDSEMVDVLTEKHLNLAKAVLRDKFIVGLLSRKKESMARFEKFFQWNYKYSPKDQEKCRRTYLREGSNVKLRSYSETPEVGSRAYELIAHRNHWDLRLYDFIKTLFIEQSIDLGVTELFRWKNATCCTCDEPPTCDEEK